MALFRADWSELSEPAYSNGIIYGASLRGTVVALRADTGKVIWRKKIKGGHVPQGIAADENGVYFGVDDGTFRSLAAQDGAERWKLDIRSAIVSRPTVFEGVVYFITGDDSLYAVNPETGEWKWQYNHGVRKEISILGLPAPVVTGGAVLIGLSDGILAAFNAESGKLLWGVRVAEGMRFEDLDATPASEGGHIYAASYDGGLAAVSLKGDLEWKTEGGGSYQPIALWGNLVVYSGRDNLVHALNRENGQEMWTASCHDENSVPTGPVTVGNKLVFADSMGHIHILDPESGKETDRIHVWGGIYQTPMVLENLIYVVSGRGRLYAIKL